MTLPMVLPSTAGVSGLEERGQRIVALLPENSSLDELLVWLRFNQPGDISELLLLHVLNPHRAIEPESAVAGIRFLSRLCGLSREKVEELEKCKSQINKMFPEIRVGVCVELGDTTTVLSRLGVLQPFDRLLLLGAQPKKKVWGFFKKSTVQELMEAGLCPIEVLPAAAP